MAPGRRALGRLACGGVALAALASCVTVPPLPPDEEPEPAVVEPAPARGTIVVCGRRFPVDAPVVPWTAPPHYDAYSTTGRFGESREAGPRYTPGRRTGDPNLIEALERGSWDLELLRRQVDQFVLHYDVCGTSQSCFRVLHDLRGLSVHFLLDLDGTIYQTLDLREQAWHARQANSRSIGIEIAHIGAYPAGTPSPLDEWYDERGDGTRLVLPRVLGDGGVRTPGFLARPARPRRIQGPIHGLDYEQYDFTPEQYASLEALTVALLEVFPRLRLEVPRDAAGRVRSDVLSDAEFEAFRGILGHYHLSEGKRDPGPAFDWERFLARVAARRARP